VATANGDTGDTPEAGGTAGVCGGISPITSAAGPANAPAAEKKITVTINTREDTNLSIKPPKNCIYLSARPPACGC
jgi:hypothetical protein